MHDLITLQKEIDNRVQGIRACAADWPCAKGCDTCCRQLAGIPELTAAEWEWLREGLASLPPEQLGTIRDAMQALAASPARPVTCPFLDRKTGACPVYAHRPIACRTYGFYVQRDKGLYCGDIEARVAAGHMDNVVWGNHDAIDNRLAGLGEKRPLTEWFLGHCFGADDSDPEMLV